MRCGWPRPPMKLRPSDRGEPDCSIDASRMQRARGHSHHRALRALGAKWLKIIFVMWERQVPYDEQYHLATMTRQQLRLRQKHIA
jgi:hypothetical protein